MGLSHSKLNAAQQRNLRKCVSACISTDYIIYIYTYTYILYPMYREICIDMFLPAMTSPNSHEDAAHKTTTEISNLHIHTQIT